MRRSRGSAKITCSRSLNHARSSARAASSSARSTSRCAFTQAITGSVFALIHFSFFFVRANLRFRRHDLRLRQLHFPPVAFPPATETEFLRRHQSAMALSGVSYIFSNPTAQPQHRTPKVPGSAVVVTHARPEQKGHGLSSEAIRIVLSDFIVSIML